MAEGGGPARELMGRAEIEAQEAGKFLASESECRCSGSLRSKRLGTLYEHIIIRQIMIKKRLHR
jgi:hypothetical protein